MPSAKKCLICLTTKFKVKKGFYKDPEITKCSLSQDKDFLERRRKLWLQLAEPNIHKCKGKLYVCSHHFVSGNI